MTTTPRQRQVKTPQTLDHFTDLEPRVLAHLRDKGELTIPFPTANQAYNFKYRMSRYKFSLKAYDPSNPLNEIAAIMTLKLRDNILSITRKDMGEDYDAVEAILSGKEVTFFDADAERMLDKLAQDPEILAIQRGEK